MLPAGTSIAIYAGAGDDKVTIGTAIPASASHFTIFGEAGNDSITGDLGSDQISG